MLFGQTYQQKHDKFEFEGKLLQCTMLCFKNPRIRVCSIVAVLSLVVFIGVYQASNFETGHRLSQSICESLEAIGRKIGWRRAFVRKDVWVYDEHSSPLDRVRSFNKALQVLRSRDLLSIVNASEKVVSRVTASSQLVYTQGHGYFRQLRAYEVEQLVATVFLSLIENGTSVTTLGQAARQNFLVTKFYRWTGVKPVCLFRDFQKDVMAFDGAYCQPPKPLFSNNERFDMKQILVDRGEGGIDNVVFGKYDRTVDDSTHKYLFFLHIFQNVIVNLGAVYVEGKCIRPNACHGTGNEVKATATYDEVFVAAIPWTSPFYHKVVESLTKMALALDFLRSNPTIRIQLSLRDDYIDDWFRNMGLDPDRIVTGAVGARIAYWPRPTSCYEAPLPDLQIMASEYRRFIKRTSTNTTRQSVIYIRRTRFRQFISSYYIEGLIEQNALKYGLRFELYSDESLPNLTETMHMFYRARVIIAPHGAGLLNMQFARPGTIVIEAVDYRECCPCFLLMSHILGHRYHAVGSDGGYKVVRVNMTNFIESVDFHLKYATKHSDKFPENEMD